MRQPLQHITQAYYDAPAALADVEPAAYFYHPDHLGSTTLTTDADGRLAQRLEYTPFGEVFIDKRYGSSWSTPFLFNAKELDASTGLYYYGARYYDPRLSIWLSPDRYERKYPFISSYSYSLCNPMKTMDINGDSTVVVVSGFGQMFGRHIMYGVNVYRNMSLENFKKSNRKNKLPTPDYNMMLARDAHDTYSKNKIVKHSEKRYGKNNECPPGTYYLSPKGNGGGAYELYIEDEIGTRTIHGPDGDRVGIAIHQFSPDDSQGCLTTASGTNTQPITELIQAIPDLKDPTQPVRIIILPRAVRLGLYDNPANGRIKYTGVEHIWDGGTLAPITITPNNH